MFKHLLSVFCLSTLLFVGCTTTHATPPMPTDDRLTLQKTPGKDFVILNLSDTQLGSDEWVAGHNSRAIIIRTIEELVARVKPDLITVSGDLAWAGQTPAYEALASYLDSFGIPWANVWGNHDNQDGYDFVHAQAQRFAKHPWCLFTEGDPSMGDGNYILRIMEGDKPVTAVFLMDTHDREQDPSTMDPEKKVWGKMFPNQLKWYEAQCEALKAAGFQDSLLVIHIPFFAYRTAFDAAYAGPKPEEVTYQQSLDKALWNDGYKDAYGVKHEGICSYPLEDNAFASVQKENFTKVVIAGHDHVNNFVIPYQGVKLVYSLKTGCGCYWEPGLNGGTVITVGDNGIQDVRHEFVTIPEELWPKKE